MVSRQVPSVGRIVHFVLDDRYPGASGRHRPAIIVHVWQEGNPDSGLQLQVFTDSMNDGHQNVVWETSIRHDEGASPRSWHWPEFVAPVEGVAG